MTGTTTINEEESRQPSICNCGATEDELKTYYVWLSPSNEKLKVENVVEVAVSQDSILFATAGEIVSVPRAKTLMVTCQVCSAPPFS
jgi:hypothetical protein